MEGVLHAFIAQGISVLHEVNPQHGCKRLGPAAIARLRVHRLYGLEQLIPGAQSIHPARERLLACLAENLLSAKDYLIHGSGSR